MNETLLPNFLILGAEKTGTTSAYTYLSEHPAIFIPKDKGLRFFDVDANYAKGIEWYKDAFLQSGPSVRRGEVSPTYFHMPNVPQRIHETIPDAQLVVQLRDPVDRAYSHYWHRVRIGRENRSFAQAAASEIDAPSEDGMFSASRYYFHVNRFLRYFPFEQFFFGFTPELDSEPESACRKIFTFLQVDPSFVPRKIGQRHNTAALPRSKLFDKALRGQSLPKRMLKSIIPARIAKRLGNKIRKANYQITEYSAMDSETEKRLRAYYARDVENLTNLIGPLPWAERYTDV